MVAKIRELSSVLVDKSASCEQRAEALKFLVHFVADIHQPLHAVKEAKGGNDLRVQFKDVFNGDIGVVERIDPVEQEVTIRFDDRLVKYDFGELDEVSLAYAVSIHKSQGSEFPTVVIPLAMQHYMLLQRNLIYTGITQGKRLLVLVGQKKALGIAVRNDRPQKRYSGLLASLKSNRRTVP